MKKCLILITVLVSFNSFGNTEIMTVKERLRLSLWFEGLDSEVTKKSPQKNRLPEELEIPIKKLIEV